MTNPSQEPQWLQDARANGLEIKEYGADMTKLATPKTPGKSRDAIVAKKRRERKKAEVSTRAVDAKANVLPSGKAQRKKEEEKFVKQIIDLAHLRGYKAAHFRPALVRTGDGKVKYVTAVSGDGKGFPDLVIAGKGLLIVAECKIDGNTATAEQEMWLELFKGAYVPSYLWYPKDWDAIVKLLV